MRARGLTLLELLIALAVILTLAALSLPAVLDGLDERAFVSASDVIRSQILMARAHAQREGHAVEVVYLPAQRELIVREMVEPGNADEPRGTSSRGDDSRGAGAVRGGAGASAVSKEDSGESQSLPESWARQVLNDGLELRFEEPTRVLDGTAAAFRFPVDDEMKDSSPTRLVVLAPDGSAVLARPAWITDGLSRVARITTNPWTGVPAVTRLQPGEQRRESRQLELTEPTGIERLAGIESGIRARSEAAP